MSDNLLKRFETICAAQPKALRQRYEDVKQTKSWTIGRQKTFATWRLTGDQIGPHVRSNDAAVRSDARVKPTAEPSKGMEKTNNFVFLDPTAEWTDGELTKLISESHTLSMRKDGGIKRGGEFADLFIAVRKALVAVPPEMRPDPPYHAGGPAAKILGNEGPSSRALAVWAAKQMEPFVPDHERDRYDKAMKLAEGAPAKYDQLWAGYYDKDGERALKAARFAQLARGSMEGGYETRASSYATDIILLLIEELRERAAGDDAKVAPKIRALIEEVDDRVLNAEFAAVAHDKLDKLLVDCERVLWRSTDAKANADRFIARIAPSSYAMITKIGKNWEWVEGTRDHVLATVPDKDMESATAVVFKRDVPGKFGQGAVVENPRWKHKKKKKK